MHDTAAVTDAAVLFGTIGRINAIIIYGQSEEDFFSFASMPRNRELMRVFKDVGLVEQLGSGMSRILKEYDRSIFHILPRSIKVVFPYPEEEVAEGITDGLNDGISDGLNLSDKEQTVLAAIKKNNKITREDLASKTGYSIATVDRIIKSLKEKDVIKGKTSKKNGSWII